MSIADLFRSKGTLRGTLVIRGLPPHKALRVDATLFKVSSASAPLPFNGEPPPKAYRDTVVVKETEAPEGMPLRFEVLRPVGFYFGWILAAIRRSPPARQRIPLTDSLARPLDVPHPLGARFAKPLRGLRPLAGTRATLTVL